MTIWKEPFGKKLRGDEFGNLAPYRNGRPHRGQDWHPAENTPIPAITKGHVVDVFWSDILGNVLIHSADGGKHFVEYAHLAQKPTLKKGDAVEIGTIIGKVGGGRHTPSGSASTGAHLHLSIGKKANVHTCAYEDLVNPLSFFGA